MNKDELIKNQFPNDEFLQSAVSQIVDTCVADLEKQIVPLKGALDFYKKEQYEIANDNTIQEVMKALEPK